MRNIPSDGVRRPIASLDSTVSVEQRDELDRLRVRAMYDKGIV